MKSPDDTENGAQLVPNANSIGMPLTTPTPKLIKKILVQNLVWW